MQSKTVLFEHPRIISFAHYNDVANAPLSNCLISGYIAAVLNKNNFNVEIYDSYLSGESFDNCFSRLDEMEFSILGIHAVYFWEHTAELFFRLENLKANRKHATVILYGFFPTFAYRQILEQNPFVDAVVIGEPEETFLEIVSMFEHSGRIIFDEIPGIAFIHDKEIRVNKARPLIEFLDSLPFPVRPETSINLTGGNILGSRGCSCNCSFCCINPFYGSRSDRRVRSPENVISEIDKILPKLEKRYIYFLDADFFGIDLKGRSRALIIAEEIGKLGNIEFGFECRCSDIDGKILSRMVKAGLRDVFLGVESASLSSLKRMGKTIANNAGERAVSLLRSCGIEPSIGFIMFEPDSTLGDIRRNFDFLKGNGLLKRLYNTADVLYHREIILKGVKHFKKYDAEGRLDEQDILNYEGFYRFADRSVQFLADLMADLCRKILRSSDGKASQIYWKRKETSASVRVNDFLVTFFDEILSKLEHRDVLLNDAGLFMIQEKAWNHVECLLSA